MYYPELLPVIGAYLIERFGNLNGGVAFLPEQIQQALSAKLMPAQIGQSLTDESSPIQIGQSLTDELPVAKKQQTLSAKSPEAYGFQDVIGRV